MQLSLIDDSVNMYMTVGHVHMSLKSDNETYLVLFVMKYIKTDAYGYVQA